MIFKQTESCVVPVEEFDYHLRCLLSEQTVWEVGNVGLLLNHFFFGVGGGILKF